MTEPQQQDVGPSAAQAAEQGEAQEIEHPDLEGAVAALQGKVDQAVELVKSDRRLDKTEQSQKLQQVWKGATAAHAELMQVYDARLEERSNEAERGLFSVIPSRQDSVRQAYNDLYDRTTPGFASGDLEGIEHAREEMERMWERAIRTGDRALETAIGQLAIERGDVKLRDAYLGRSKEKAGAWERYVAVRRQLEHFRNPQERMWANLTGRWYLKKPEGA